MKLRLVLGSALFLAFTAHADIQPYPAPIWCKGDFRCVGMTYPKGKVSANNAYWSERDCVADLKAQVAGQCPGGQAEILNLQITNKNTGGTTTQCQERNFYFPWGAISGANGGFGSVEGRTEAEARYGAYASCRKHANSCSQTVSSPRNGCVGYFRSTYFRRDYFYTGCSSSEVRNKAQSGCAGALCHEVDVRCAH